MPKTICLFCRGTGKIGAGEGLGLKITKRCHCSPYTAEENAEAEKQDNLLCGCSTHSHDLSLLPGLPKIDDREEYDRLVEDVVAELVCIAHDLDHTNDMAKREQVPATPNSKWLRTAAYMLVDLNKHKQK